MNQPASEQNCSCEQNTTTGIQIGDVPCCGPPLAAPSSHLERPGYTLGHYVTGFVETSVGSIPRVKVALERRDYWGGILARLGPIRNDYKVTPGLYAIGNPSADSPVLVSANYKLSFDALRRELEAVDAWVLVLDTRGINVWCAAGKGTFSTAEVVDRIRSTGLEKLVTHRELILPQLAATGVCALEVKKQCGFKVIWGPIRATDIGSFLLNGHSATRDMRSVTFTLRERWVLIPVELYLLVKPLLWTFLIVFILSGIGPDFFSLGNAFSRGLMASVAIMLAIFAGAVMVPLFLPWIPGRAFALKGLVTGVVADILLIGHYWNSAKGWELLALIIGANAISSYLAMNFTGSTPFTSPTGVEREMRKAIPLQLLAVVVTLVMWIGAAFI